MRFYRYPAIISLDSDTGLYSVEFVDFPLAIEDGIEKIDLDQRARELLYRAMDEYLESNETLPKPSKEPGRELKEGEEFRVIQLILG